MYQTKKLEQLIEAASPSLFEYLKEKSIDFMYFGFRWMVCFFVREFSLHNVIYLWDHYLTRECDTGFAIFHIYTAAAFLLTFEDLLKENDDQTACLLLLQKLPTKNWGEKEMKILIEKVPFLFSFFFNYFFSLKNFFFQAVQLQINHPFLIEVMIKERATNKK